MTIVDFGCSARCADAIGERKGVRETILKRAVLQTAAGVAATAMILGFTIEQSLAQDWTAFGIREAGFTFDVPPGFALDRIAEDGQAATFLGPQGASLNVRGEHIVGGDFKKNVELLMAYAEGQGWELTYRRLTKSWASYSGVKDGMIRYVRAINICSKRIAAFRMDYRQTEKLAYDPLILRMVESMNPESC